MSKRMGILFSCILFSLWAMHIIAGIIDTKSLYTLIEIDHIIYFSIFCISFLSIYIDEKWSRFIHIFLLTGIAIYTLYSGERGLFTGLSVFFIDIISAYGYGIYSKHTVLRLSISCVFLYVIFLFCPYCCINYNKYLNAGSWILFLAGMCFAVWFIFKDQIEKLKTNEQESKERYMRILEEATSVARDAIALLEKEKQKIENERE